jgi:cephalosporin-C deacetylase-like acetyl esterase
MSAAADHPGGIYHVGETVGWTLILAAGQDAHGYHFAIKGNGLTVIGSGDLTFSGGTARIEQAATEPGMLYVEITAKDAGQPSLALGAAVDPQRLAPAAARPHDFASFWARKLRELAAVPAHPLLLSGESGRPGVDYATLTMDSIHGTHIHGQIARPSGRGRLPGLLIFQWAGGPYPLKKQWVTDRAAEGWLALNIEPHDVLPDQPQSYYDALPEELKHYQMIGGRDRDRNYFLRMYLADHRAIEYLAGRPDWDGRTLVVMGTSMGGQQSLCAAALSPKVTALIVNEPSGADSNGGLLGRVTGYPNWPGDDSKVMRTALYFDTVSCAVDIRVPSMVAMGFIDTTAPPAGIWTAFNQIAGPKEAVPMALSPHNHLATAQQQQPYTERSREWLESLRTTGRPPSGGAAPR